MKKYTCILVYIVKYFSSIFKLKSNKLSIFSENLQNNQSVNFWFFLIQLPLHYHIFQWCQRSSSRVWISKSGAKDFLKSGASRFFLYDFYFFERTLITPCSNARVWILDKFPQFFWRSKKKLTEITRFHENHHMRLENSLNFQHFYFLS